MHEYEVENFIERSMRGKRARAEQGLIIGMGRRLIYGYRRVQNGHIKDIALDNEALYSHPEIESRRDVVRWIFTKFVEGMGATEIADTLHAFGIPARDGVRWIPAGVYDVLHREAYRGQFYGHKYQKVVNPTTGKNNSAERPREQWISITREDLRIVPDELFLAAKERIGTRRGGYTMKYEYLFSRRVTCQNGHRMTCHCTRDKPTRRYQYYQCYTNKFSVKKCDMPGFNSLRVDEVVWNWVVELIKDPAAVLVGLQKAQQQSLTNNADAIQQVGNCEKLLKKEQAELEYLIEEAKQFKDKPRIREQYREQIAQCNQRIEILERERAKLEEQLLRDVTSDEEIEHRVQEVERLAVLRDRVGTLAFEHRRRAIELLNIHIGVGMVEERKYVDIIWYETADRRFLEEEETLDPISETSTN